MHRTEGDNFTRDDQGRFLFKDGPPGTTVPAAWLNAVQEEIAGVIESANIQMRSQGNDTRDQLVAAINQIIATSLIGEYENAWLFRNAIINPIDEEMVDQYGNTGTAVANDEYAIDRWKVIESGTNPTFDIDPGSVSGIRLTANATETTELVFSQIMEDKNYLQFAGKTIVVSAKVRSNNSSNCRLLVSDDGGSTFKTSAPTGFNYVHSGSGNEETLAITFTVSDTPTSLNVYIGIQSDSQGTVSIASGDYVQFKHCQLSEGQQILTFSPRSFETELGLCQRYYYEFITDSVDRSPFGYGSKDTVNGWVNIPTPVTMRAEPTISASGTINWHHSAGENGVFGSLTVVHLIPSGVIVQGSTGGSTNSTVFALIANAAVTIILDAEL